MTTSLRTYDAIGDGGHHGIGRDARLRQPVVRAGDAGSAASPAGDDARPVGGRRRRQRPARLLRLAADDRGAAQPRARPASTSCTPPGARCSAARACRRWTTCRSRSTWCCSASPTRRWRRPSRSPRRAVTRARSCSGRRTACKDDVVAAAGEMALVGGGCMGFVDTTTGVRAIGYLERDPLPAGPIALVTHSGSVFSALLRTHRRLDYSVAVSSGQELVTHHGRLPGLRAVAAARPGWSGWCSRRCATPPGSQAGAGRGRGSATSRCVALTVGSSVRGQALVDAHSGAIAGSDAGWEALFAAYGVHRCSDLDELTDSLETFAIGRRPLPGTAGAGSRRCTTREPSGCWWPTWPSGSGVRFADAVARPTVARLAALLDPGLEPTNPLDVWGSGADTEELFADVPERRWPTTPTSARWRWRSTWSRSTTATSRSRGRARGLLRTHRQAGRRAGQPAVGGRPGRGRRGCARRASRCSRARRRGCARWGTCWPTPPRPRPPVVVDAERATAGRPAGRPGARRGRAGRRCSADYGIAGRRPAQRVGVGTRRSRRPSDWATRWCSRPTQPSVHHKTEAGRRTPRARRPATRSARRTTTSPARLGPAGRRAAARLAGVEVALGIVRDPLLGPLVVVAAGGTLVELVAERAVALPPLDRRDRPGAGRPAAGRRRCSTGTAARRRRTPRRWSTRSWRSASSRSSSATASTASTSTRSWSARTPSSSSTPSSCPTCPTPSRHMTTRRDFRCLFAPTRHVSRLPVCADSAWSAVASASRGRGGRWGRGRAGCGPARRSGRARGR